jgi:coenzyme F420-reducing hydrogenase delta subunit
MVKRERDNRLKTISLPCSGKLELIYLLKAFESGADGAMLVTCKEGECRYLEGNLRAQKRSEAVSALLEETGFGSGRMKLVRQNEGGLQQIIDEIDSLTEAIRDSSV